MKKIRLLVVDDEENIRILFKEELEDEGYSVDVAADGEEAIKKVKENHFDLIILDIKMPGMDGITVLNTIKNMNKNLPVVLCSAYGEFRQDFSSWVSDAYVVKSADLQELKQTIKNLLHL